MPRLPRLDAPGVAYKKSLRPEWHLLKLLRMTIFHSVIPPFITAVLGS